MEFSRYFCATDVQSDSVTVQNSLCGSVLLYLSRFVLWLSIWSMRVNVPRVFEKDVHSACWMESSMNVNSVILVDTVVWVF